MAVLCCKYEKCPMAKKCLRFLEKDKANEALLSDFHTFCNKKNDYLWVMLDKNCKNKKMKDIYAKRKNMFANSGGK